MSRSLDSPLARECFRLPKNGLDRGILQIRRIAVLAQNAFYENPHAYPRTLSMRPINADRALKIGQ